MGRVLVLLQADLSDLYGWFALRIPVAICPFGAKTNVLAIGSHAAAALWAFCDVCCFGQSPNGGGADKTNSTK